MSERRTVLSLLVALSMITYLDRVCIAIAGPRMQAELNITPGRWGWILGAFVLSYGLFEIPTGALGDKLETMVADDLWPLPTYREMLFIK